MDVYQGIFVLISLASFCNCNDDSHQSVVIETPSGPVRGYHEALPDDLYVHRFIKIPYAHPPLGDLRFKKPKPVGRWTDEQGIQEKNGPACMQEDYGLNPEFKPEYTEDCLYLNIYVPGDVSRDKRLSVMLFIHGGGFVMGSAGEYNGQRLAAQGDVIVVIINYRLGLFGFLNLLDPIANGNYALWDQMAAIRWVHENIEAFGGNPDSVTIFGESAGGMSVHHQTLIPANIGMFQRAISMSGVVNKQIIMNDNDLKKVFNMISDKTDCKQENKAELLMCLQKLTPTEILGIVNIYEFMTPDNYTEEMLIGPSIDGDLTMVAPSTSALIAHSRKNTAHRTYNYILSAPSPVPFEPPPPAWFSGAGHADDLYLLFDMPILPTKNRLEERHTTLSSRIIRYFTNFAKTGDPNSEELPVTWPPYDVQTREYLDFDFELSVNKDFHVDATRIFQPQLRELFQNEKQEL
uniref:Carboxylic ester hydrolase n=1 Tax=Magallana gigas TaxID=29159 RepID=A0A8W8NS01_MAGGI